MSHPHFLFLQGPHGPFFSILSRMLRKAGSDVTRIGFNAGDRMFWPQRDSYLKFDLAADRWPAFFRDTVQERGITDICLYGDTRPIHAQAIAIAREMGLRIHVFEEGYLRPYWVTYERDGSNGHSRLVDLTVPQMRAALSSVTVEQTEAPAHWGDMREHVLYGALYHWFVLFWNRGYRHFQPHRPLPLLTETLQYTRRLVLMPLFAIERGLASWRVRRSGHPYHLVLLQLDHDANFREHSPFSATPDFLREVIDGFAAGAPLHHHLVIKAHPLEPGRYPLRRMIRQMARAAGIRSRVHYVRGGKLAALLDHARSAVTVNSTAGQQALWRGIPLKAFGTAVYSKPEFVSDQPIAAFFANPTRPDVEAYRDFRQFLLESSQVSGGFYAARGRRQLLRQVVDMMLADQDPYDIALGLTPTSKDHLRVVTGGRGR